MPADTEYFAAAAGDSPFSPGQLLPAGMALSRPVPAWYHPDVPEEKPIPFDYTVLYEDRDLIVVDKPHFYPRPAMGDWCARPYRHACAWISVKMTLCRCTASTA